MRAPLAKRIGAALLRHAFLYRRFYCWRSPVCAIDAPLKISNGAKEPRETYGFLQTFCANEIADSSYSGFSPLRQWFSNGANAPLAPANKLFL
jgi:hypothetical protein